MIIKICWYTFSKTIIPLHSFTNVDTLNICELGFPGQNIMTHQRDRVMFSLNDISFTQPRLK